MAHFPSHIAFLKVFNHLAVLAKQLNKPSLRLSLTRLKVGVFVCHLCDLGLHTSATCDLQSMKSCP